MRNPGGYLTIYDPDPHKGAGQQTLKEYDSFTCGHCNSIVKVKPFCDPADAGGLCKQCMNHICKGCYSKGFCAPFEEKLRLAEHRQLVLRSYGF